jgi:hypothetical protein
MSQKLRIFLGMLLAASCVLSGYFLGVYKTQQALGACLF